jgi:hypothetical protein
MKASWLDSYGVSSLCLVDFHCFKTLNCVVMSKTLICNNYALRGKLRMLIMCRLWTRLRMSFNAYMSILVAM